MVEVAAVAQPPMPAEIPGEDGDPSKPDQGVQQHPVLVEHAERREVDHQPGQDFVA